MTLYMQRRGIPETVLRTDVQFMTTITYTCPNDHENRLQIDESGSVDAVTKNLVSHLEGEITQGLPRRQTRCDILTCRIPFDLYDALTKETTLY
jgi:hypothetical protein